MTSEEKQKLISLLVSQPMPWFKDDIQEKLITIYQHEKSKYDKEGYKLDGCFAKWCMCYAFSLGHIMGIREERAKRKDKVVKKVIKSVIDRPELMELYLTIREAKRRGVATSQIVELLKTHEV